MLHAPRAHGQGLRNHATELAERHQHDREELERKKREEVDAISRFEAAIRTSVGASFDRLTMRHEQRVVAGEPSRAHEEKEFKLDLVARAAAALFQHVMSSEPDSCTDEKQPVHPPPPCEVAECKSAPMPMPMPQLDELALVCPDVIAKGRDLAPFIAKRKELLAAMAATAKKAIAAAAPKDLEAELYDALVDETLNRSLLHDRHSVPLTYTMEDLPFITHGGFLLFDRMFSRAPGASSSLFRS